LLKDHVVKECKGRFSSNSDSFKIFHNQLSYYPYYIAAVVVLNEVEGKKSRN